MTKPNILELAKQGNPQAIAALMNHSLKPKGITANVETQGDRLQVLLEGEQLPNQSVLTSFVKNGLNQLNLDHVTSVQVSGQRIGAAQPAWTQDIDMKAAESSTPIPGAATSMPRPPVAPPPPPKRPTVPPPPPRPAVTDFSPNTIIQADDDEDIVYQAESATMSSSTTPDNATAAAPVTEQFDDLLVDEQFIDNLLAQDEMAEETVVSIVSPSAPSSASDGTDVVESDWGERDSFNDDDFSDDDFSDANFYDEEQDGGMDETMEMIGLQPEDLDDDLQEEESQAEAEQSGDNSKRPSRILFILVLFIMLGWLAGMIGYSLWSHLSAPSTPTESAPSQSLTLPDSVVEPTTAQREVTD
jgi:hypothetical protein